MAVLLHAAAQLAHVVVGQAHRLLPEGQLLVALGREQADIEVLFGEIHGGKCSAKLWMPDSAFERTLADLAKPLNLRRNRDSEPSCAGNNSYKRRHDSAPTRLLERPRVKGSAAGEWPPKMWEGIR